MSFLRHLPTVARDDVREFWRKLGAFGAVKSLIRDGFGAIDALKILIRSFAQ